MTAPANRAVLRRKGSELAVAGLLFGLGALVAGDSLRLGASWADDGPQAGYFPLYVGLSLCAASLANALRALALDPAHNSAFAEARALRRVLGVLIPTAIYAAAIGWLGLYVASALFVAGFMRALGGYRAWVAGAVAIGNSALFFAIFELWFHVPLPKGPLEAWLGVG
jgi:hypothetical protein